METSDSDLVGDYENIQEQLHLLGLPPMGPVNLSNPLHTRQTICAVQGLLNMVDEKLSVEENLTQMLALSEKEVQKLMRQVGDVETTASRFATKEAEAKFQMKKSAETDQKRIRQISEVAGDKDKRIRLLLEQVERYKRLERQHDQQINELQAKLNHMVKNKERTKLPSIFHNSIDGSSCLHAQELDSDEVNVFRRWKYNMQKNFYNREIELLREIERLENEQEISDDN